MRCMEEGLCFFFLRPTQSFGIHSAKTNEQANEFWTRSFAVRARPWGRLFLSRIRPPWSRQVRPATALSMQRPTPLHRGSARSLSFLLLLSVLLLFLLLSFSLFLLLFSLPSHFLNFFLYLSRLVSSSFRALSSFNLRFPNVSIVRLRVPPRR